MLEKLAPVKLLWTSKDRRLLDAQLQLLHNQYPQDLAIHHQLIDNLLQQGDNQAALLQAKELEQNARMANSAIYQTRALLIQASASWDNPVLDQNVQLMDRALALVDAAVAPFLQSEVLQCYAGIHYQQNNFSVLEQKLLRALEQAQLANAPEQQAQVLRSLAVFSHKFKPTAKLDAALLLLQLHEAQMQPELQQQYRDFIQKNASRAWRHSKLKPLTALGLAVL